MKIIDLIKSFGIRFPLYYILLRYAPDSFWNFLYKNRNISLGKRVISPRAQGYLEMTSLITPPVSEWKDVNKVREGFHKARFLYSVSKTKVGFIKDFHIEKSDFNIPVRLYEPEKRDDLFSNNAVVFIHGGGLVVGTKEAYDGFCRQLSNAIRMPLFSIDYRLAPEYSLEEIQSDTRFFWQWLQDNCSQFGVLPECIGLCGESAGASLSLDICEFFSQNTNYLRPKSLALIYPPFLQPYETDSRKQIALIKSIVFNDTLKWFESLAIPNSIREEVILRNQRGDLSKFPPVFLLTCGFDPLRDEGEVLASFIKNAGVKIEYREYRDMFHGFVLSPALFDETRTLANDISLFFHENM